MPRVANWASTWANHVSGSLGQKGGSLRATVLIVAAGVIGAPSGSVIVGVTNVDQLIGR